MSSRFGSALLIASLATTATAQRQTRAESLTVANALNAVRRFQTTWERAWFSGQSAQHRRLNHVPAGFAIMKNTTIRFEPRKLDLHCYFGKEEDVEIVWAVDHDWGLEPVKRKIPSATNDRHWTCPNWLPPEDYYLSQAGLPDEGVAIDNALEQNVRRPIHDTRELLIRELRVAVKAVPRDSVLFGQYIRMLVDNGDIASALTAVDNCGASPSWCLALRGYVNHRGGNAFDAEDAFLASLDAMAPSERCAWASIRLLLDDADRKSYAKRSCAGQDSASRRVWWLADPLWSVPGNDRFNEQFARKVVIALHAALGRDERYNWTHTGGGDALAEMIERYGWMSYTYIEGPHNLLRFQDPFMYVKEKQYLDTYKTERALGGYRTTYEYSLGRVHLIPPMSMADKPFDISNEDWSMNAPCCDVGAHFVWWPVEHYVPSTPIVKLVDQQTVFLRRQDSILFAYSTALARTDLGRTLGDSVNGVMLASGGPGAIKRIADSRVGAQSRLALLGAIPAVPSLISVEVPSTSKGDRAGRTRFGVKPPPPLSEMNAGEIAISDPVLLVVPEGMHVLPAAADSAVPLMLGSMTLAAGTSAIGVYWETYGIAPRDSVDITVTVRQRANSSSRVTTSWSEPQTGRTVRNLSGAVPIQMRSVILNISALPTGAYTLEVGATKRGMEAVKSSREFTIR